ncbi:MAG: hypothetical protein Q8O55_07775 [Dehalococcoidales bacterium]|nr:hypothetical protein [Dehalococcoidales bacterium]
MRLIFIIDNETESYTWKHVIPELGNRGHQVKLIARDCGFTPAILHECGFQFDLSEADNSDHFGLFGGLEHLNRCDSLSRLFSPTMFIGSGLDAAITAARLKKPAILFIDDEHSRFRNRLASLLGTAILTPDVFKGELGKKQTRIRSYKELAYLHPNYFRPDITIFDELKIARGEKYIILCLSKWNTRHNFGSIGFLYSDEFKLVSRLGEYAHVFISLEGPLPAPLEKYRLSIPYTRFHHALYYAQMLVGDTRTSAVEAAVLSTPSILVNENVFDSGNIEDLNNYGLLFCYRNLGLAINKALELIKQPDLKDDWAKRRRKMLAEKIDICLFLADFVENYGGFASSRSHVLQNTAGEK